MKIAGKFGLVVACALIGQGAVAFADPATQQGSTQDSNKSAQESCPKGMVKGPDGVCAKPKSGQMGFDLAGPSDDSGGSSSSNGTRSTGNNSGHH